MDRQSRNACVVVGNGESLQSIPLEKIAFPCIAVNRIHKIYPFTTWRPEYYVRTEPPAGVEFPEEFRDECRLHAELGEQCTFPKIWKEWLGTYSNVTYRSTCRHFSRKYVPSGWHLPMLCDYGTVITAAIQEAVIRGFGEIVLVGCDITGTHFRNYGKSAVQSELWLKAHELAKKECPIPIYNCTLGGSLEVYERRPVEYILSGMAQA